MAFTLSKANLEQIQENIAQQRDEELLAAVEDLHPADIAEILDELKPEEARYLFGRLAPPISAEVMLEVPEVRRENLLENFTGKEIAEEIIEHVDSDDAADILYELTVERRDDVLNSIQDQERRSRINELLTYDENTAGSLMGKELVTVNQDASMLECVRQLRTHSDHVNDVYVILVVDDHDRLVGTIPIKALLTTSLRTPVKEVLDPDTITIHPHEHVEEASRIMEKYDLVVLPVVDDRNRLLGRITIDDVVDAIREEETEDAHLMAGMEALEYSYSSSKLWQMVRKRVGWLIILFIGESFTATAMGFFTDEIEKAVVLALFVPLIISSGGNTGSQASTLIIRALSLGDITTRDWWRIFRREAVVGLILGVILAIVGFLRVAIWSQISTLYGPHWFLVGLVVAFSLVGVVVWGNLIGSLFPLVLKRLGLDPATASAPFVATVVDVTGLVIYFSIAAMVLRQVLV